MRYGGKKEGGAGYHFMDIKTSPQQVRIIDYPANMQRNLNAACWFIVHKVDSVLFGLMRVKSHSAEVENQPFISHYCFFHFSSCLLLLEDEAVQYPASKRDPVARPAQL